MARETERYLLCVLWMLKQEPWRKPGLRVEGPVAAVYTWACAQFLAL